MSAKTAVKRARILIVDDHPAIREALAQRIGRQPDLEVCGEAADAAEALRLIHEKKPDAALIDISLKGGNGIDLIKRLKAKTDLRVLVCSMHNELFYAERALRAGARGYISKEEATDKIVEAIRQVLKGKVWLSEAMSERLLNRTVGKTSLEGSLSPVDALADRELEVFRCIGTGLKTAEIARQMHLSVKTIETYRDRIRHKLGLSDGTRLIHHATQWVLEEQGS